VKQILVVDDSPSIREHVKTALQAGNYETLEAIDGVDGLEKLRTAPGVALVVCDVHMPRMGGLEMLDALNRSGRIKDLVFLLLTSEAQPALLERAKKAGARAWLVKPFNPSMFLAAIRKLIGS
jgi:two-component system chemotaxis response regulator CheY